MDSLASQRLSRKKELAKGKEKNLPTPAKLVGWDGTDKATPKTNKPKVSVAVGDLVGFQQDDATPLKGGDEEVKDNSEEAIAQRKARQRELY